MMSNNIKSNYKCQEYSLYNNTLGKIYRFSLIIIILHWNIVLIFNISHFIQDFLNASLKSWWTIDKNEELGRRFWNPTLFQHGLANTTSETIPFALCWIMPCQCVVTYKFLVMLLTKLFKSIEMILQYDILLSFVRIN